MKKKPQIRKTDLRLNRAQPPKGRSKQTPSLPVESTPPPGPDTSLSAEEEAFLWEPGLGEEDEDSL